MFEVFEGGEEENVETKMVPISTCKSKGTLNIKQIYQNAEDLHNTKDEFSIFVKVFLFIISGSSTVDINIHAKRPRKQSPNDQTDCWRLDW